MVLQSRHSPEGVDSLDSGGGIEWPGFVRRAVRRASTDRIQAEAGAAGRSDPHFRMSRRSALPRRPIETGQFTDGWPPLWWVGCHGGAGTTTLATLTGLGIDALARPGLIPAWSTVRPRRVGVPGHREWRLGRVGRGGAVETSAVPAETALSSGWWRSKGRLANRLDGPPNAFRLLAGWVPATWRVGWAEGVPRRRQRR